MNKSIKHISLLMALLMIFTALSVALTGCGGNTETTTASNQGQGNNPPPNNNDGSSNDNNQQGDYAVLVKTAGGMKLSGVNVTVYSKSNDKKMGQAATNTSGAATFNLNASDEYYAVISNLPEGYSVESRYNFAGKDCVITVTSSVIQSGENGSYNIPGMAYYKLGSVMHDFAYTDIDGRTFVLSEILAEKQGVLLNFWYTACTYCIDEFPMIDAAYLQYTDDIEVLALNNYEKYAKSTNDTPEKIEQFRDSNSLNIPMIYDQTELMSAFDYSHSPNGLGNYPISIMIDRYGVVCMIQVGAILGGNGFLPIFNHFASDEYEQKIVTSLEDIAPAEKPNVKMPSSEEIAAVFNGIPGMDVRYYAETSELLGEYSWPFIITEKDGTPCIAPSNAGAQKHTSYSFLHADIQLKKGDVLAFDHYTSTEKNADVLTAAINGESLYGLSGITQTGWETRYVYVAEEDGLYTLSLCYVKDSSASEGEDNVYLKNLRIVEIDDIDVDTHIPRYAATNPTVSGNGYNTYAEIFYNAVDGYYHVKSENGPILLAYMLGATHFNAGEASINDYAADSKIFRDYFATTDNIHLADEFYAEAVSGGYKLYRLVKGEKQYLDLDYNGTLKQPTITYETREDAVKNVFTYDAEYGAWTVTLNKASYYLGVTGQSTLIDTYHLLNTLVKYRSDYFPVKLLDSNGNAVTAPVAGQKYQLAVEQGQLNKTLYLTGNVGDVATDVTEYASIAARSTLNGYCPVTEELRQLLMKVAEMIGYGDAVHPELEWMQVCRYYDAYGKDVAQLEDPTLGLSYHSAYPTVLDDPDTVEVEKNSIYYDGRPLMPRGLLYKFVPTVSGVYNVVSDARADIEAWIYMDHADLPVYTYEPLARNWFDGINCSMYMYMEAGTAYYINIAFVDMYGVGNIDFTLSYVGIDYSLLRYCSDGYWTSSSEDDLGQSNLITGGLMNIWYDKENDRFHEYYTPGAEKINPTPIYVDLLGIAPLMSHSVWNIILESGCNFALSQDDEIVVNYMNMYGEDYKYELKLLWGEYYDEQFVNEVAAGQYHGMMIDYSKTEKDVTILKYYNADPQNYKEELQELWGEKYDETYVNETVAGNYHGSILDYARGQVTDGVDYTEKMQKYLPVCQNPDAPEDEQIWIFPEGVIDDPESELYGCMIINLELAEILQHLVDKYSYSGVPNAWSKLCVYYQQLNADTAIRA